MTTLNGFSRAHPDCPLTSHTVRAGYFSPRSVFYSTDARREDSTIFFIACEKESPTASSSGKRMGYPRMLAIDPIEWEHEVRVLLRSNRTRSSPASFGVGPRTSDPFVFVAATCRRRQKTEPGPLTHPRIVPFDRGGYTRLGVIGNQDHRSTGLPRPTPFSSERQPLVIHGIS
jgi:hypothetical protein